MENLISLLNFNIVFPNAIRSIGNTRNGLDVVQVECNCAKCAVVRCFQGKCYICLLVQKGIHLYFAGESISTICLLFGIGIHRVQRFRAQQFRKRLVVDVQAAYINDKHCFFRQHIRLIWSKIQHHCKICSIAEHTKRCDGKVIHACRREIGNSRHHGSRVKNGIVCFGSQWNSDIIHLNGSGCGWVNGFFQIEELFYLCQVFSDNAMIAVTACHVFSSNSATVFQDDRYLFCGVGLIVCCAVNGQRQRL